MEFNKDYYRSLAVQHIGCEKPRAYYIPFATQEEAREELSKLIKQEYPQISEALTGGEGDLENACDGYVEAKLQAARYVPFGVPAVLSFLCELEYEIKNVRIILAGKAAGLSQESIARRVRGSYV